MRDVLIPGVAEPARCGVCGKPTPRLQKSRGNAMYCSAVCRSDARSRRQSEIGLGKLRAPVPTQPRDKHCSACKRRKALDEFGKNRSMPDGHAAHCTACKRRMSAESRERHRETLRLRQQEWRKNNLELAKQLDRDRYAENKSGRRHYSRARRLRANYGITLEQFDQMAAEQKYACAICGEHPAPVGKHNRDTLNVDHDHSTGKVRGLLCVSCNLGLGNFGENPARLLRAMDYLARHRGEGVTTDSEEK